MRDYCFGNFLHELRTRRGLSQYQLGALVGVSFQAVSKWENGTSKPQSKILYRLSEVLGVSVDELLACKYRSDNEKSNGVSATKNVLFRKAFDALRSRYGETVPLEIINRFASEHAAIQYTDMIVYFDMLATLSNEAKKRNEYIWVRGGTGASFIAYLLGATEINPLKAHYYCPNCRAVIFDKSVEDGWDLENRKCDCGVDMIREGHDIPIETYRHVIMRQSSFDITVSPTFFNTAKDLIREYFKDSRLVEFRRQSQNDTVTFVIIPDSCDLPNENCLVLEEYYEKIKTFVAFTFFIFDEFEKYKELISKTGKRFEEADFLRPEIIDAFSRCETDSILEFKAPFIKDMIVDCRPKCFRDLIQISGLAHGSGTYEGNAKELISEGVSVSKVIAYRDDVFNHIQQCMLKKGIADTSGLAYKVMEDTRKGIYERGGVSDEMKGWFKEIGMEEWFADSIEKIKYLFPKAHGVTYVKFALTLMWYKLNYPNEFKESNIK